MTLRGAPFFHFHFFIWPCRIFHGEMKKSQIHGMVEAKRDEEFHERSQNISGKKNVLTLLRKGAADRECWRRNLVPTWNCDSMVCDFEWLGRGVWFLQPGARIQTWKTWIHWNRGLAHAAGLHAQFQFYCWDQIFFPVVVHIIIKTRLPLDSSVNRFGPLLPAV